MFHKLAPVVLGRPLSMLSNIRLNDGIPLASILKKELEESIDVVVGTMFRKVVQHDPWNVQVGLNVLFHPARDKNAEGYERVFVEEEEHPVDELLDFVFVLALVQSVQHDEKWASCQP
jgi:hypothetical protein